MACDVETEVRTCHPEHGDPRGQRYGKGAGQGIDSTQGTQGIAGTFTLDYCAKDDEKRAMIAAVRKDTMRVPTAVPKTLAASLAPSDQPRNNRW